MRVALAVAAAVVLLASASLAVAGGSTAPYMGIGGDAAALQRAHVIGGRAGYENDTYLSNEAAMLTTWPEPMKERDYFHPKLYLPGLAGSSYRVIRGLTSGIVLGIRLIGIQARPTVALFKPFIPVDEQLVHQEGTVRPLCRGWIFTSASLTTAIHALAAEQKVTPDPANVYVHAWWVAPTKAAPAGSAYLDLRTTLGTIAC